MDFGCGIGGPTFHMVSAFGVTSIGIGVVVLVLLC